MNELFQFNEDFEIEVSPLAVTLLPFKKVMDKYTNKYYGILELSFIAFLLHPQSNYADIRNEEDRRKAIIMSMADTDKIKFDKVTDVAIEFYKERNHTVTSNYLDDILDALDKTGKYFREVDYSKLDKSDKLVYDPKKVIDAIKESPKVMQSIRELKELIKKEQELDNGVRGSGQKGVYEDI
jgi:predicted Zn-dependent protease